MDKIKQLLNSIYGEKNGVSAFLRISPLIENFPIKQRTRKTCFSQEDVVLITYGDTLKKKGESPISTIHKFANKYLKDAISTIHFLPFFPFSSDDGFSIIDFYAIDSKLGSWNDVNAIGGDFQLMFDYVLNHFSSKSKWFENYLEGKKGFKQFAIEVDPLTDLSQVTRPRSLPLLTEFKKHDGQIVHLWTTFSADQIDFNFKSLDVIEKMIEVLLFYVQQGATILRLDAIAYLWKEIGTSCIHLNQVHLIVKLFRSILDLVAPDVMIISETNVPHDENISYFGNNGDEAQMVYNFTLPPLLFYSFVKEDATFLSAWAKGLYLKSEKNAFYNFTASHDGIGVRPLEGILPQKEINALVKIVKSNGGQVSYKKNPDGSKSPYELNISYIDAFWRNDSGKDPLHANRFMASQAIQYVLPGVPATYIHSLIGSRNWIKGVKQTGRARTINREKLQIKEVIKELKNTESFRSQIFYPYLNLIKIRKEQPAFHPNADFEILDIDPGIFVIKRYMDNQRIYAITNISSAEVALSLPLHEESSQMSDLLTGEKFQLNSINLKPYQFIWLS
ncbi:MAG: sugar phosphorylase [Deltaproteobacteria bacterium]|nr:sugar phosphorylase [Deltaproteobacteria bacterium]